MTVIALPNLTLTVTPPGGSPTSYTNKFAWDGVSQTPTITQNFGRQGDTATFTLVDEYAGAPNFYIPPLSQISLYDNTAAQNLFAGVVNAPTLVVTGTNRNEWVLQCTDYTIYADNINVVGTFNGLPIDQIVVLLTQQANCGITATTVANGGFVSPAPVINTVTFNYVTLANAWLTLSQLAGTAVPYGWYVDENLALHFYSSDTAQESGVTFTTAITTGGSLTEGHIYEDSNFGYEWDGTTLHNKILIQGATQTFAANLSGTPTDTWMADGTQTAWPLRFTASGTPTLTVNSVNTTVVLESNGTLATSGWAIEQNAFGQWFLITTSAPSGGSIIKLWYDYQVPIIAQASDYASQLEYAGPNGGIYEEFISDSTLTTSSMALARAQRERTEYAFVAERATFTTSEDWIGWIRAGWTFTFVNKYVPDSQGGWSWGINDEFIVVANTVTFGNGGYRTMSITAVRV